MRPESRRRRTFLRVALVLFAAVAASGFGARAARADPTVQLTLDQTSIPNNGSVTMTMTVSSALGYPSGRVSFVNAAVPGTPLATVTVTPTGAKSSIATTGSLTFSSPPTSYLLYAVYVPDMTAFFLGLEQTPSATQTLTVAATPARAATGVTLSSSSLDVDTTTPVTLTATVAELAPGGTIPTGTVSFSDVASGVSVPLGTKTLDSSGTAQLVVPTFAAGDHHLVASYNGSDTDKVSSSDPPLVLSAHPPADPRLTTTSIVSLVPPTIALGDTVTIVATIAQSETSSTTTPPGGQVTFSSTSDLGQDVILGHAALGTVPDGSGLTAHPDQAVIQVSTWERAAEYAITASYIGDIFFKGSASAPITLSVFPPGTVTGQTNLEYTGPASADYHDSVTLSATVADPTGRPVADGAAVRFVVGSQQCDATTAAGVASCDLTITQPAGAYAVTTTFAGKGALLPTSVQSSFAVVHEEALASVAVSGNVLAAAGLTLTGTLLEDGTTAIAGRTLTLSIGGLSCDAVTNAAGVASCSPSGMPTLGPTTSIAEFTGDDFYVPASASAPALLYALGPGGGSFVIGDRNATVGSAVTYWGSQWWKLNTLSRSSAPSSFKGFAAHPASPACGTSWTTDPGNSTPPPAGPLPAYMAVIATSSSSKSGSMISGTTAHVVIVKTTPGYDANPGHSGTGTVVATVC